MAIAFIGISAVASDTTTPYPVTPTWPAAYTPTAGHFALIIITQQGGSAPSTPSGWTIFTVGDLNTAAPIWYLFWRILAGSDVLPTITMSSGGNQVDAWTAVWSGVDATTPSDATPVEGSAVGVSPYQPPPITTVTNGADIVNMTDTNFQVFGLNTANSFTSLVVSQQTNRSHGIARYAMAVAGSKTNPSWDSDFDNYNAVTIALRPDGGGGGGTVANQRKRRRPDLIFRGNR